MSPNIYVTDLLTTQNGLRNSPQVERMIRFVKAGGYFTKDARLAQSLIAESVRGTPPPIHIALMEDGRLVLHDGHHRAVALLMGGRHYIDGSEYEMVSYSYADYSELHPDKGWFTPFDVKTEVRLPDFGAFKMYAKSAYFTYGIGALRSYVFEHRRDYKEPRRISTVEELSREYQRDCKYNGKPRRRNACV